VITTSGPSTGISADVEKVRKIKSLAGQHAVGLASGVTSENIHEYIENTDISIVAT
jgi:predicted TIM-barrel enzyme